MWRQHRALSGYARKRGVLCFRARVAREQNRLSPLPTRRREEVPACDFRAPTLPRERWCVYPRSALSRSVEGMSLPNTAAHPPHTHRHTGVSPEQVRKAVAQVTLGKKSPHPREGERSARPERGRASLPFRRFQPRCVRLAALSRPPPPKCRLSHLAVWLCDLRKDAHNRSDQVKEPHVARTPAAAAAAATSELVPSGTRAVSFFLPNFSVLRQKLLWVWKGTVESTLAAQANNHS